MKGHVLSYVSHANVIYSDVLSHVSSSFYSYGRLTSKMYNIRAMSCGSYQHYY